MIDSEVVEISFLERVMLFRYRPVKKIKIAKNIFIIVCNSPKYLCVLRFSYLGNTQFHPMTGSNASKLCGQIAKLLEESR